MNAATPKSAARLIAEAFAIYGRYPLLFLVLAASVIVPYELVLLAATGAGPLEAEEISFSASVFIAVAELALVTPLVSALHVHAVADVRDGRDPDLGSVTRRSLRALPIVAAASVMSWLGIFVGCFALLVPGVYLFLRWFVVAQAAAIEREGWLPALRRSHQLVSGHYGRVAFFFLALVALTFGPVYLVSLAFNGADPASVVVGILSQVLCVSFGALTTALLYFDLRLRFEQAAARGEAPASATSPAPGPPRPGSLDPRDYSDDDRPAGWYVDPVNPLRMRYWTGGEAPAWAKRTTRTPRKVRARWERRGADP